MMQGLWILVALAGMLPAAVWAPVPTEPTGAAATVEKHDGNLVAPRTYLVFFGQASTDTDADGNEIVVVTGQNGAVLKLKREDFDLALVNWARVWTLAQEGARVKVTMKTREDGKTTVVVGFVATS